MNSTTITVARTGSSPDAAQALAERDAHEIAEKLGGIVGNQSIHLTPASHLFAALAAPEYEVSVTFELVATTDAAPT